MRPSQPHTTSNPGFALARTWSSLVKAGQELLRSWKPDPIAWLVAVTGAVLFTAFSVAQWRSFVSPSWDLGIFTQLAQQYARLDAPIVDIKGPGYNLLGDHFHPILVALGPVFRLFPSGLSLLILQGLLFAWSSVPITRLARTRLGTSWGSLLGVGYILSWGLAGAVAAQFHEIAFAVPLLAFGLVHWLEGKHRAACIEMGMLVFVKEDLGLTVAAFGLILLWLDWGRASMREQESMAAGQVRAVRGRAAESGGGDATSVPDIPEVAGAPRAASGPQFPLRTWASLRDTLASWHQTPSAYMFIWGLFWFVASIAVILPLLNPNGGWDYTNRLSEAQDSLPGLLGFFTSLFGPGQKIVTLMLLALSAGIVGLRSPLIWLMVPTLAWRFAGNVPYYWGWDWHYSAILVPIAAAALIDGVERTKNFERLRHSWQRKIVPAAVLCAMIPSLAMSWNGPMGSFLRGANDFHAYDREAGRSAVEEVGTGRAVVADIRMLAYVVPGNTAYWEGTVADAHVDTIIVGPSHAALSAPEGSELWASEKYGGQWAVAYHHNGFLVLKRD